MGTLRRALLRLRLREIAAAVDPNIQLRDLVSMEDVLRIYALMSMTVAQRRKEIGIRAALGADPRRIVASIFSRALAQLAIGAILGVLAAALFEEASGGELMLGHGAIVLPIVALVGLLAAVGPARGGLRIQPTEALRES